MRWYVSDEMVCKWRSDLAEVYYVDEVIFCAFISCHGLANHSDRHLERREDMREREGGREGGESEGGESEGGRTRGRVEMSQSVSGEFITDRQTPHKHA